MSSTHRWLRAPEDPYRLDPGPKRPEEARGSPPILLPQAERRRRVGDLAAKVRGALELALGRSESRPPEREALTTALDALAKLEAEIAVHSGPHAQAEKAAEFTLPPEGVPIEEVERSLVEQALARAGGNRTRAGTLLGLTRDQVRYRIEKFGLDDGESH